MTSSAPQPPGSPVESLVEESSLSRVILSSGFNRLKRCRYGYMLYNVNDVCIGRSLDVYGENAEDEVRLFKRLVRPGGVVLDVGANIGDHTLFFARATGPAGLVIAFEPQRIVFQTLCANVALNGLTNVHCLLAALGAAPGGLVVPHIDYAKPANFGGVTFGHWQEGEPVPVFTLDGFNLARCDFLKVDVEGMEIEVLQGGVETIRRHRPVLHVENDRPEKSEALIALLRALGYRLYWHRTEAFNPGNFYGNPENVFPGGIGISLLCLPEGQQSFDPVGLEEVR